MMSPLPFFRRTHLVRYSRRFRGRSERYALIHAFALTCLVLAVGCTASQEEDHLEHHVPAHKPKTFADAVTQLEKRFDNLNVSAVLKDPVALQEFGDVIGWLPEISADSDLNREEWEQVQVHWRVLDPWYSRFRASNGKASDEEVAIFRTQLQALREYVVPSSRPLGEIPRTEAEANVANESFVKGGAK